MTSIAQIVRGIIDDLSDGVSELVLLVVVMSEQNAAVPPPLPVAASVVNQTANTLANIARELAKTDYADFDEIVQEINQAAGDVEGATRTMEEALKVLQGDGDRRRGWNGLCDACRIMSGKTVRLLQIVYGADLKRLQLTADQLDTLISNVPSATGLHHRPNQQRFVNDISHITPKALKMVDHLRAKGDSSDNPFTGNLLRQMADDLKKAVDDMHEAGNKALQNPQEYGKDFDNKLAELKKQIARAKEAATKEEPTAAAQRVPFKPLYERAKKEVAAMPAATKGPPAKYQRQEKQTKDAVQEVIRAIKPNPRTKRAADKVEASLADQILAARDALRKANASGDEKAINDATKALLDALNRLRKVAGDGEKVDKDDMNDLMNALAGLKNLQKALGNNPSVAEQMAYEQLKDDLANLKRAIKDGDMKEAPKLVRKVAQSSKGLSDALKNEAANPKTSPYHRQHKLDAANDIDKALPKFVSKAKNALNSDLKDDNANNELLGALRKLRRGADRGAAPTTDEDMSKLLSDLLAGLRKTQRAVDDKDGQGVDEGLAAIRNALAGLRKAGDRIAENHDDRSKIDQPLDELDRQINIFADQAKKGLHGDQGAKNDMNNKSAPAIEKAVADLEEATSASKMRPIAEVERKLFDLGSAVDNGDGTRLTPAAQGLVEKVRALEKFIDDLPPPQKNKCKDHVAALQPLMRDAIMKAKESVLHPDDSDKLDAAHDAINAMRAPLFKMKEALDPPGYQRPVEGAGADVKRALQELRDALASGDKERIRDALDNLKRAMAAYNGQAEDLAAKKTDPKKQEILASHIDDLKDKMSDIRTFQTKPEETEKIRSFMDGVEDSVDLFMDAAKRSKDDDIIVGAAQAANLIARLGNLDDDDMDLGDLLGAAGQLGNLLSGLVTGTSRTAQNLGVDPNALSDAAKSAMQLDQLLCRLEGKPDPYPVRAAAPPPPVEVFESAPETLFVNIDLDSATSFEDIAAGVAFQVHEAAKGISADADSIAVELANLGNAARGGDRQALIKAARAAAAHIAAYVKKLLDLASKITGNSPNERRLKESLHRAATGLRDMGTQLKILSTVKAATIEDSKDTDATLSTLTRNLGEMLKQGLTSMQICQSTLRIKN